MTTRPISRILRGTEHFVHVYSIINMYQYLYAERSFCSMCECVCGSENEWLLVEREGEREVEVYTNGP